MFNLKLAPSARKLAPPAGNQGSRLTGNEGRIPPNRNTASDPQPRVSTTVSADVCWLPEMVLPKTTIRKHNTCNRQRRHYGCCTQGILSDLWWCQGLHFKDYLGFGGLNANVDDTVTTQTTSCSGNVGNATSPYRALMLCFVKTPHLLSLGVKSPHCVHQPRQHGAQLREHCKQPRQIMLKRSCYVVDCVRLWYGMV